MRFLTINIQHGGGGRRARLIDFIGRQSADVLVLTEYRLNIAGNLIRSSLAERGYFYQAASSLDSTQNSVCIVSRLPFNVIGFDSGLGADSHRILAVQFESLSVVGVYFPQKEAKRPVFDSLKNKLLPKIGDLGLVLGDFNTGRPYEDENGETFHCADCFEALLSAGLIDSWRSRNPMVREFTWYSRAKNGFRIDHALSTPAFNANIQQVEYLHESRELRITDHSALLLCSDG
jgi:exodeoxyribonuclease III